MSSLLHISLGDVVFENFKKNKIAFVDKTDYIQVLESLNTKYPIFLRPRRFGKTTFIEMLKCFYDLSYAHRYQDIFEGTKIYKQNLLSHNSYYVLDFDFSGIMGTTEEELKSNFYLSVRGSIVNFKKRYPNFVFDLDHSFNNSPTSLLESFLQKFTEFDINDHKLYILIDEYDQFANEVLNMNRELFKTITGANGFVKSFYSIIKKYTKTIVDRTFITGVSSVSLDSLTSGFNIAQNVSFDSKLNAMVGFTHEELKDLISKLIDLNKFSIDLDSLVYKMHLIYNGYAFSSHATEKIFNSSLCMNYLYLCLSNNLIYNPERVSDEGFDLDRSKIFDLIKYSSSHEIENITLRIMQDQSLTVNKIVKNININKIISYDHDTILSLMLYLGYLTIVPNENIELIELACPNKYVKNIFTQCFFKDLYVEDHALISFKLNVNELQNSSDNLCDFFSSCENYLSQRFTNQHFLNANEKYLVGILKTKLEDNPSTIVVYDEYAVQVPKFGEKRIDLYLRNEKGKIYIFEFKYLSKSTVEVNSNLIEQKYQEAIEQIKVYKTAYEFANQDINAYAIVFVGAKCERWAKV